MADASGMAGDLVRLWDGWWWVLLLWGGAIAEWFGNVFSGIGYALRRRGKIRHKRKLEILKAQARANAIVTSLAAPEFGPCRHRRITGVRDKEDNLVAWLCRNEDCGKQLPKDFAVYEEDM